MKTLKIGCRGLAVALGFAVLAACGETVNIDIGRQLFVDDALVGRTEGVVRHWNRPVKEEAPIVWTGSGAAPSKTDGSSGGGDEPVNLTAATDGGLWWDPTRRMFRLWYQADWLGDICYAESADGRTWTYPDLGIVPGTNRIFEKDTIDSWCVMPDYAAENPYAAWRLHISEPGGPTKDRLFSSEDGIHFKSLGVAGWSGDRSTSYYDPFRRNWVFSLREGWPERYRRYFASKTFGGAGCRWRWTDGKGAADAPVPEKWLTATGICERSSLYSFNAVAYESLMLGVMEVLYGTPGDNADGEKIGMPKQTGLHFCFSRDGKTFAPRKEADIAPSGLGSGKWDSGYLSPVGGICFIRDERLWFYYSGLRGDGTRVGKQFQGSRWQRNGMYSNGSIGVASLRRDGFAGMVADGKGTLETKPVAFTGGHLFVNAECRFGTVAAEVLGEDGKPVKGFALADCRAMAGKDSTKTELTFAGGDLSALGTRGVRIRFHLKCATLYSFWVSPSERGESRGYVAAGGPDYPGLRDSIAAAAPKRAAFLAPPDAAHARDSRTFAGIPSIAVDPVSGRLWATWYASPFGFENVHNYVILATSADGGKKWKEVLVYDPDGAGPVRAFDPEVWVAPDGCLRWSWTNRRAKDSPKAKWGAGQDDPEALAGGRLMMLTLAADREPSAPFGEPQEICPGVMMCKPIVAKNGDWVLPVARWFQDASARLAISSDGGRTFRLSEGGASIPKKNREFDEHSVVEMKDGTLRVWMRTKGAGCLTAATADRGRTWTAAEPATFGYPNTRTTVRRLKSGAILLVKHGSEVASDGGGRRCLTAFVSDDEARTWKGGLVLDPRTDVSYCDVDQSPDGTIYATWDCDRTGRREILFARFTEEVVRAGRVVSPDARLSAVIK